MTSFAFILGVMPLLITTGAGAEMRRQLGTAVFAGMLGVTLFGIFLTPVFFYVIAGLLEKSLFSSREMRLAGKILLHLVGFLSLGLLWVVPYVLGVIFRRPSPMQRTRTVEPTTNGPTSSNGEVAGEHDTTAIREMKRRE
jgi:hypothetical protein